MKKPQGKPVAAIANDAIDDTLDRLEREDEHTRVDHAVATSTPGERFVSGIQELKE